MPSPSSAPAPGLSPGAVNAPGGGGRRLLLGAGAAGMAAAPVLALTGFGVSFAVLTGVAGAVAAGAALNVTPRVAPVDRDAARRLMGDDEFARPRGFAAEVDLAYAIQAAVFAAAPFEKRDPSGRKVALPMGGRRELSDLVRAGSGYCFDRSRAIETLFRLYGMPVRHASIFSTVETGSTLRSLLKPDVGSHAVSEVRTERGWMVVDSNFRWVGVAKNKRAFDLAALSQFPEADWDERNLEMGPKLQRPFTWVYGLYSRHGRFYPPYAPLPNLNWRELLHNLRRR